MTKKRISFTSVAIIIAAIFGYWVYASQRTNHNSEVTTHPQHSTLNAQPSTQSAQRILYWVDPMHPSYKSDKPGIAPDCGMELTPVYAEDKRATTAGAVRLSGRKQQLINLKLVEVSDQQAIHNIHTVGTLQYDETKIAKIHSKIEGWIEKVYVDSTGSFVRKGQPLFSIYSPDLLATQQEYLLAIKADQTLQTSEFPDVASGASALRASAYQRLKLWDVSDQQIKKLEQSGKPLTSIAFYSPVSGFVIEKNIFEKQRIDYNTEAYTIADLSTVWLMADVYEYEAQNVRVGQSATVTLSYNPQKKYEGSVTYIYPDLNNATRTLKARIEFRNQGFELKPGMYANVELQGERRSGFAVPVDAVLDSGTRKIVFVQKSQGEFEPREVELGAYFDNNVIVIKGLSAGEKVVASGNFLIDSESELKSALESMQ